MKFSDYKIKMQNFEYTESIPKCGYGNIHNCKRCPYVTKSLFHMVNHAKRYQLPLKSSSCERNDLENHYCKNCNFESDLVVILKQHLREYHRKDTDCVQDQPKSDSEVKSYICPKCSFETYSVLLWIKHFDGSCFDTEEDCEKVDTASCSDEKSYRREYCYKRRKGATVLKKHQNARHPSHRKEKFRCFHCNYKGKTKNHLREHLNYSHAPPEAVHWFHCNECQLKSKSHFNLLKHKKLRHSVNAVHWFSCDKCEFRTKRNDSLTRHKKIHFSANAVQWYSCDKGECKTKYNRDIKEHKTIQLSTDAIQWYSCDKCEFKTKRKDQLKRHTIRHLSADAIQWYICDKCEFETKRKDYLKYHKNSHCPGWLRCDKCKYKTKRNDQIKQHKKKHL
jgi:hypothetical protein